MLRLCAAFGKMDSSCHFAVVYIVDTMSSPLKWTDVPTGDQWQLGPTRPTRSRNQRWPALIYFLLFVVGFFSYWWPRCTFLCNVHSNEWSFGSEVVLLGHAQPKSRQTSFHRSDQISADLPRSPKQRVENPRLNLMVFMSCSAPLSHSLPFCGGKWSSEE